jgi:hypothetical protein
MASLNHFHVEEMIHRLSVEIFCEQLSDQTPNPPHPYYQQNPNSSHLYYEQVSQQYYPSRMSVVLITNRKSLSLVPDKVQPHIPQVPSLTPMQQLELDFHRYIQ